MVEITGWAIGVIGLVAFLTVCLIYLLAFFPVKKKADIELLYVLFWAFVAVGLIVYKYLTYGCILICGDWYDD